MLYIHYLLNNNKSFHMGHLQIHSFPFIYISIQETFHDRFSSFSLEGDLFHYKLISKYPYFSPYQPRKK